MGFGSSALRKRRASGCGRVRAARDAARTSRASRPLSWRRRSCARRRPLPPRATEPAAMRRSASPPRAYRPRPRRRRCAFARARCGKARASATQRAESQACDCPHSVTPSTRRFERPPDSGGRFAAPQRQNGETSYEAARYSISRFSQASAWPTMVSRSSRRGFQPSTLLDALGPGDDRGRDRRPGAAPMRTAKSLLRHALHRVDHLEHRKAVAIAAIQHLALAARRGDSAARRDARGRDR